MRRLSPAQVQTCPCPPSEPHKADTLEYLPLPADAAFCQNCGWADVTTVGALRDQKADEYLRKRCEMAAEERRKNEERAARERQEHEIKEQKLAATRARLKEIERQRGFSSNHKFCTGCGSATESFLFAWALDQVSREYPDLVRNEDEFNQLLKERI